MSMQMIAKFLKINSGLYGTQTEEERAMSLPAEGQRQRYGYALLDIHSRQIARSSGYYGTIGGELGAIFRDSSRRSLLD